MKHKTAELDGDRLAAAVAIATGKWTYHTRETLPDMLHHIDSLVAALPAWLGVERDSVVACKQPFPHGLTWSECGPIIEGMTPCDLSSVVRDYGHRTDWYCGFQRGGERVVHEGPTALIAAMRAFVAAKLGEEVELP